MKVLLIEDELHKRDELRSHLEQIFDHTLELVHVGSVRDAVLSVSDCRYDLIVLDMALPTFSHFKEKTDGGHDQALGGIEVLRTLRSKGLRCTILIVTQYPDITLDGRRIKLKKAAEALSKKYEQKILGAVLYKYKSSSNKSKITTALMSVR